MSGDSEASYSGPAPVEHRDKVDALAPTISEMASVSHVRQKEPLTATRWSQRTPARVRPIRRRSR